MTNVVKREYEYAVDRERTVLLSKRDREEQPGSDCD